MRHFLFFASFLFIVSARDYSYAGFYEGKELLKPVIGKPVVYEVKFGESLYEIARKFNTTMAHIRRANGLPNRSSKIGKKLIIPGFQILPEVIDNGIVLNVPELRLYLFKDGNFVARYPVTAGRLSMRTPIGDFKVISKVLNPTWSPPAWAGIDRPVPPGPHNPLGDKWIGLNADGVGIHSTNAPSSIGNFWSHGCVRMYPWHAAKLFKQVSIGMPVHIVYKPVKVGVYKGKIYMEVHPDAYGRGKLSFDDILSLLDRLKIRDGVDEKKLARIYREARGIPEPIFGEDLKIIAGGDILSFDWPVLLKDGSYYVHLQQIAKAIGLDVVWDDEEQRLHVGRGGRNITYEMNTGMIYLDENPLGQGAYVVQVRGELYVPLKYTLQALSFPFHFDLKKKVATIEM